MSDRVSSESPFGVALRSVVFAGQRFTRGPVAVLLASLVLLTLLAASAQAQTFQYAFYPRSDANTFSLDGLSATQSGATPGFGLTVAPDMGPYALSFGSSLNVPAAGTYTFNLSGAEASRLVINGVTVAERGIPGASDRSTVQVNLQPGVYPMTVEYYGSAPAVDLDVTVSVAGSVPQSLQQGATGTTGGGIPSAGSNAPAPAQTAAAPTAPAQPTQAQPTQVAAAAPAAPAQPGLNDLPVEEDLSQTQANEPASATQVQSAAAALANRFPDLVESPGGNVQGPTGNQSTAYNLAARFSDLFGSTIEGTNAGMESTEMSVAPGVNFQYFDGTGSGRTLAAQSSTSSLNIAVMTGEGSGSVVFSGYLNILNPGRYLFTSSANGRATLRINGRVVVNGSGGQGGVAALGVGLHPFELSFSGGARDQRSLTLMVEGPGMASGTIPQSMLFRDPNGLDATRILTVNEGSGSGLYVPGTSVSVTANPAAADMVFDRWAGNGAGFLADITTPSATFTMPDQDITLTATYRARPANTFQLTVVDGSGDGLYAAATPVQIVADANDDPEQAFVQWSVSGADAGVLADATAATTTLTMPAADVSVTATYAARTYDVTITNGSGSGTYAAGDLVVIAANPAPAGMTFAQWSGDTARAGDAFDAFSPSTTLVVPSGGITLTATYIDQNASVRLVFTSPAVNDLVDEKGFTVNGIATADSGIAQLTINALIGANATPLFPQSQPVSVGPTGRFAFRFFDEDIPERDDIQIVVQAMNGNGQNGEARLALRADALERPLEQLLSRITWGVTPEMQTRARQIGYDAFLAEQLAPTSLNDSVRQQLNPDGLLRFPDNNDRMIHEAAAYRLRWMLTTTRQFQDFLGYYWDNHFNTFLLDRRDWEAEYLEADGFRQNALGIFRNLVEVSAKSGAMMKYLNNNTSVAGSINENYARELLELHIVGVNAGYGPDDIVGVANILTGWGTRIEQLPGDRADRLIFEFDPDDHDQTNKTVPFLNRTFIGQGGANGIREGEQLLDALVALQAAAEYNCGKFIELLVNDTVPAALLSECVSRFQDSGGDIGAVMGMILRSPEFRIGSENFRAKFKTPLEYYVSLIRNFGIQVDLTPRNDRSDSEALEEIDEALVAAGNGLWRMPVPTGYDEDASRWANSGSLVERFNFALDIFRGRHERDGITFDPMPYVRDLLGLETAEEIATYFMTLSMGDRYTRAEYEAVMTELLGSDGVFDITTDEEDELIRAFSVMATMPSFQYQ